MKRTAIFPGSFDPITKGHQAIVERALHLFDEVIIAIGINANKKTLFSEEERIAYIKKTFKKHPQVKVCSYNGLTVDFCKDNNVKFILRGLRSGTDFEYEKSIHQVNKLLATDLESVLLFSDAELGSITSSIVREVLSHGGDISSMVPEEIVAEVSSKAKKD